MGGGANRARGRGAGAPEGDESARGGGGDSARAPALVRTPKDKAPPSRRGGGRAGVRGRGAGHWAWGLGKPAGARRADSTSEGGREPLREGGGGIPPSSESAGRRPTVRVPGGGEGVSEAGGAEPGARTGPEATEAREGSALTPVEETPKQGPAGRTGRGPQWGAGLGTEGGDDDEKLGEGRVELDSGGPAPGNEGAGWGWSGANREQLSLTSGWKAAAQESESMFRVGGGGCGSAEAGIPPPNRGASRGWGLRRPGRTGADRGGVASARGDGGSARRVAFRTLCSPASDSTAKQS